MLWVTFVRSFLPRGSIALYGRTTVGLSVLLSVGVWAISKVFGHNELKRCEYSCASCVCGHVFISVVLFLHLRVEKLDHRVSLC